MVLVGCRQSLQSVDNAQHKQQDPLLAAPHQQNSNGEVKVSSNSFSDSMQVEEPRPCGCLCQRGPASEPLLRVGEEQDGKGALQHLLSTSREFLTATQEKPYEDDQEADSHTASWVFLAIVVLLDTLLESMKDGSWNLEVPNYQAVVLLVALKFHHYLLTHALALGQFGRRLARHTLRLTQFLQGSAWLLALSSRVCISYLSTKFAEETAEILNLSTDTHQDSPSFLWGAITVQLLTIALYVSLGVWIYSDHIRLCNKKFCGP